MFIKLENAAGLVFVVTAVCFKFLLGHTDYSFTMGAFRVQTPTGFIITLAAWGCLFWYYMEIIYAVAFDVEDKTTYRAATNLQLRLGHFRKNEHFWVLFCL